MSGNPLFVRTKWTPELVIEAIREFHTEFQRPPHQNDWTPVRYKWRQGDNPEVIAERTRIRALREWPSVTTAVRLFGSWNAAIAAAGFEPTLPSQGRMWERVG